MFRFEKRRVYIPKLIAKKEEYSYSSSNELTVKAFLCVGRDAEVKSVIASYLSYYSNSLAVYDEEEIEPAYYTLKKTWNNTAVSVFRQRTGDLITALLKFGIRNTVTDARSLLVYLQENTDIPVANEWADEIWNYFLGQELLTKLFTVGVKGVYYEANTYDVSIELEKFIGENLPKLRSLLKKPA
jgi:hypothetical protein